MAKVAVVLVLLFSLARASPVDDYDSPSSSFAGLMPNFYAIDSLPDGETERRVHLNGVALKETSAVYELNGVKEGAILRQLTDGRHLIQLIYDANESLTDCEYVSDAETVERFQQTLADEYLRLSIISSNNTIRYVESSDELPHDLAQLSDYARLKRRCRALHKKMRKAALKVDESSTRRRRSADDMFMIPHTKWCGKGNRASGPSQLGGFAAADRCCRQHDQQCPHFIHAWSEKYDLFNSRPYTAMHCTCDDRFRSCLKQANTAAANLVGKLFFNVIQTKCFVLKPEKVCKHSSWWGKCTKYTWEKKAIFRDPIPF